MTAARILEVTDRIKQRSHDKRALYLERLEAAAAAGPRRSSLGLRQPGAWVCGLQPAGQDAAGGRANAQSGDCHRL